LEGILVAKLQLIKLLTGVEIVGEMRTLNETVIIDKPMRLVDLPQLDLYFARVSPYTLEDVVNIPRHHILFGPQDILPEFEKLYQNWDRYYTEFAKSMSFVLQKTNDRMEKSLLTEKEIKEGGGGVSDLEIHNLSGEDLTEETLNDILASFKPTNKKNAN